MSSTTHMRGVTYLTSKEAGRLVGYTSDYITKLARDGKILSRRDGIQWFVELASLQMFLRAMEHAREERKERLRDERRREREAHQVRTMGLPAIPATSSLELAPYTHTAVDVRMDVPALVPDIPNPRSAHTYALAALVPGIALALVFTFSTSLVPIAERSTASLGDVATEFSRIWRSFAFLWTDEVAQAPTKIENRDVVNTSRTQQGIVVLPKNATDQTVQKVKDSFSDEVNVALEDDGTSGTIVPIFRDGVGDEYRFVIVPVAQSP